MVGVSICRVVIDTDYAGDAISIFASDMIWIDHVSFSLIGRQFIDTGYPAAGRITISNSLFDGRTPYSATCNGMHYWAIVLYGKSGPEFVVICVD